MFQELGSNHRGSDTTRAAWGFILSSALRFTCEATVKSRSAVSPRTSEGALRLRGNGGDIGVRSFVPRLNNHLKNRERDSVLLIDKICGLISGIFMRFFNLYFPLFLPLGSLPLLSSPTIRIMPGPNTDQQFQGPNPQKPNETGEGGGILWSHHKNGGGAEGPLPEWPTTCNMYTTKISCNQPKKTQ